MRDETLRHYALLAGVAPDWTDQTGAARQVAPDSLRAILTALGHEVSDAAMAQAVAGPQSGAGPLAGFHVGAVDEPLQLMAPDVAGDTCDLLLESGGQRRLTIHRNGDRLILPAIDTPGYHRLDLGGRTVTLAIAPQRCVRFGDLGGERQGWGLAAQIYALRSEMDGGIGTFAGVAALGQAAARLGADALAVSPVHALYGALPQQFSPYSPSTRLFFNPLHADATVAFPMAQLRDIAASAGVLGAMEQLSAAAPIDWPAASAVRLRLLRALFAALPQQAAAAMDFASYAAAATPALRGHALFETLHRAELARDPAIASWRDWRPEWRDPRSAAVAAFAAEHAEEVRFQLFLQWLTERSYGAAQTACRAAGMRVGLIADLAIGMDGGGSHAWSQPQDVLHGLSIGAPPDYYAAEGQNWALTTFSPRGLEASGYAPFIDTLRASLRHVGGVRIDHVMGMRRLWLIPEGAGALDGAYVSFPSRTLFRLLALESFRHQAIVIGEDLGTLPHGFREELRDQGVAGLRVLRFERTQYGYVRPWDWDRDAVALTSTHDLPPTAAWWAGADLAAGDEVGAAGRAWDRGVLWGAFVDAGLASGERPAPDDPTPVVDAAIRYVAATPCTLRIIPIEDALGLRVQPNVPGTTTDKPNWRHRIPGAASQLLDAPETQDRLAPLSGGEDG